MELIFGPTVNGADLLRDVYRQALNDAIELRIASAYLTHWDKNLPVNSACEELVFVVGTDFGLTRKGALRDVLRWLPSNGYAEFLAVPKLENGGFHPKIVAWRTENGECYALIGSSNLTRAAFENNYEANAFAQISDQEFSRLTGWLNDVAAGAIPITEHWIDKHYREAKLAGRGGGGKESSGSDQSISMKSGGFLRRMGASQGLEAPFQG